MSVHGETWERMRARRARKKLNRALRLVGDEERASEPIIALTAGQNPDTPHKSLRTEVFYIADGEAFFVSPSAAQASAPGQRVRTTTVQGALRRGLKWDEVDRRQYEAEVRARSALTKVKYTTNEKTGARLKKS